MRCLMSVGLQPCRAPDLVRRDAGTRLQWMSSIAVHIHSCILPNESCGNAKEALVPVVVTFFFAASYTGRSSAVRR